MRLVSQVVRAVVALAFVGVAGVCIWRGMRDLFWAPAPPGVSAAQQAASMSGVMPALLYFTGGVLALLAAAELSARLAPAGDARARSDGG